MGVVTLVRRVLVLALAIAAFTFVSLQFAHMINENIAMANSLSAVQDDIEQMRERRRHQEMEIRRLNDPDGAVPEIHERLRLVRPNEALIYVKPAVPQKP